MIEGRSYKNKDLLNTLCEMQASPAYAVRKQTLQTAEQVIANQEVKIDELHAAFESMTQERDKFRNAFIEFMDKTEWVAADAKVSELGKHRADVIRERMTALEQRIADLEAANRELVRMGSASAGDKV